MLELNFSLVKNYLRLSADISLESERIYAVVGPSGAGKSTFLNILSGFTEISNGSIVWNRREISGLPPSKRNISILFYSERQSEITLEQNRVWCGAF